MSIETTTISGTVLLSFVWRSSTGPVKVEVHDKNNSQKVTNMHRRTHTHTHVSSFGMLLMVVVSFWKWLSPLFIHLLALNFIVVDSTLYPIHLIHHCYHRPMVTKKIMIYIFLLYSNQLKLLTYIGDLFAFIGSLVIVLGGSILCLEESVSPLQCHNYPCTSHIKKTLLFLGLYSNICC